MDPETRTLLKVERRRRGDGRRSFQTLMGDEVEPRRVFIEENARYARWERLSI